MKIDLSGSWNLRLDREGIGEQDGWNETWGKAEDSVQIPGILQAQGFGDDISIDTPWVSGLHDQKWYLREEYKYGNREECRVPFLAQPPKHYTGKAWYQRTFYIEETGETQYLAIELAKWRSSVWIDGCYKGTDMSLCAAHEILLGILKPGSHVITVCIDNSFLHPYRPDGHGVSDALAATWNGMVGEVAILSAHERNRRNEEKRDYADNNPRHIEVHGGMFLVDGRQEYFRGTHFGGDFPLTGCPSMVKSWWLGIMETVKAWGLNFIRCHSYCPPEAAFQAADEAGVYLQVECGMWNIFNPGIPMLDILRRETRKILDQFGHHPSFVLFSPTNEPGGQWYEPLKEWVEETREYDAVLGYGGRRMYTAQSGWFYDVPPKDITGTDYIYFHRSAYGPILGGNIRNYQGWRGGDYRSSLEGAKLPVICHELGQWCSYPDFSVIDKFTGYMKPGNYEIFRESARRQGVLAQNKEFTYCSGKNQVLMYKEDLEANFRTPHMYGFELLDLHDYLGQGTALIGVLDPFWEEKGYVTSDQWKEFCGSTVLLARFPGYVYTSEDVVEVPLELSHFGEALSEDAVVSWKLTDGDMVLKNGWCGLVYGEQEKNISLGSVKLDFACVKTSKKLTFCMEMGDVQNHWDLSVFAKKQKVRYSDTVVYTKNWKEAKESLKLGEAVVFCPPLSSLDYDCPPLSMRPVFWNAQMGPSWTRGMGLVCREGHPVFKEFPTDTWGGWQWEDILTRARGFETGGIQDNIFSLVTPIDEWNRNLPLSMMFECRMLEGRLLFVSADLEGGFGERPAAWSLKQAVLRYAASPDFRPEMSLEPGAVERRLYSNHMMEQLGAAVVFEEDVLVTQGNAMLDGNPNTSTAIEKSDYPICVDICLKQRTDAAGLIYLAGQKDRMHEGDICGYRVLVEADGRMREVLAGELTSSCRQKKLLFSERVITDHIRLEILSGFGTGTLWKEDYGGWRRISYAKAQKQKCVKAEIAILGVISMDYNAAEDDNVYWNTNIKSATKEIDD